MRTWHLAVVFAALALLATVTSARGIWIADARVEYSIDPGGFLAGHGHLWDATRGIGNTSTFYTPAVAGYQALLGWLGADAWLIERLLHASYLCLAATGLAALVALTTPRVGSVHLLAGLIYAFNPFVSQFLVPSGLFLSYALAPWFLLFTLRGVGDRANSARYAALFALGVFVVGVLNTASLLYALAAIPIALAYVVVVERSVSVGRCLRWLAQAAGLAAVVSTGALVVLWFQRSDISLNLATTERLVDVAARSSPAESWRGFGLWLTYFEDGRGPLRPQSAAYFDNPFVIVATYAAPLAAGLTLTLSKWRPRFLYASSTVVGVLLMVGVWPPSDPSPLGELLNSGFENAVVLKGLRTTYKAGSIFMIGIAVLAGYGVVSLFRVARSERRESRTRSVALGAAGFVLVAAMAVAAFPFWTGGIYPERDGYEEIPQYWTDAFDFLDDQPDDGRVLVLPGVIRTRYRWGYVNDNLFHGLLDRSLAMHQSIPPPGTPLGADLILAVDEHLESPGYRSGTLGPILQRLGVAYVLIQNDVDWQSVGVSRPSAFDTIRSDEDLDLVAEFGRPGQNTVAKVDDAARTSGEDRLSPVQVYRVVGATEMERVAEGSDVVVSGAGDSWPQLSRQGWLGGGAVRYSGGLDADELATAVADGAPVVVTDGNRRHFAEVSGGRLRPSITLSADAATARPAFDLFGDPSTQTVATYRDATTITANRTGTGFGVGIPPDRAALAFDREPETAWVVSFAGANDAELTTTLRRATEISSIEVRTRVGAFDRRVSALDVDLELIDGDIRTLSGSADAQEPSVFDFDVHDGMDEDSGVGIDDVVALTFRFADVTGPPSDVVGISEVVIRDSDDRLLDLREFLRTPVDVAALARSDAALGDRLSAAGTVFSFGRRTGAGSVDDETGIRREFEVVGDGDHLVTGTVRLGATALDQASDVLLGGTLGAFGSSAPSRTGGWGANAVDDDRFSAWYGRAAVGETLTVRLPDTPLTTVTFETRGADDEAGTNPRSLIEEADVRAVGPDGTIESPAAVVDRSCDDSTGVCTRLITATFPTAEYSSLQLVIDDVAIEMGEFGRQPVVVSDVLLDGELIHRAVRSDDEASDQASDGAIDGAIDDQLSSACVDALRLDGTLIPIRLEGARSALLRGDDIAFESCDALELTQGRHRFETESSLSGAVDAVEITPEFFESKPAADSAGEDTTALEVVDRSPTRIEMRISAGAGSRLIGPGSFHPGWTATVDGVSLGAARPLDAQSGWVLPPVENAQVVLNFRPQRTYELSLASTAAGVALCLFLVLRRRRW